MLHKNLFTVVRNGNHIAMSNSHLWNKGLTLHASGLLTLLLSLPPDWDFTLRGLAEATIEGKQAVSTALKELEEKGFLTRQQVRSEGGCFAYMKYTIYEWPPAMVEEFNAKHKIDGQAGGPAGSSTGADAYAGKMPDGGSLPPCPGSRDTAQPDAAKRDTARTEAAIPEADARDTGAGAGEKCAQMPENSGFPPRPGSRDTANRDTASRDARSINIIFKPGQERTGQDINHSISPVQSSPIPSLPSPSGNARATQPRHTTARDYKANREYVRQNIGYSQLCDDFPDDSQLIDEIVEAITETVCTSRSMVRIASDDFPADVVRERLLGLTNAHIRPVIAGMKECGAGARNRRQYLRAALFNAMPTAWAGGGKTPDGKGRESPAHKPPSRSKSSSNRFNNFPQRDYDFDELERQLLNS